MTKFGITKNLESMMDTLATIKHIAVNLVVMGAGVTVQWVTDINEWARLVAGIVAIITGVLTIEKLWRERKQAKKKDGN